MTLDKDRQREYQREWMRRRREEFFRGKVCLHCGSDQQLTIDHIDRTKKVSHRIWSWSESRRNEELKKCQILCDSCHKAKTREYGDKNNTGTLNHQSKLDDEKVRTIRRLVNIEKHSKRSVARMFGVDEKIIRELILGNTWKHVPL